MHVFFGALVTGSNRFSNIATSLQSFVQHGEQAAPGPPVVHADYLTLRARLYPRSEVARA